MLQESPLRETVTARIAASTVGPHRRLTLPHLIRLFQEAAMQNTDRLGVSSSDLTAAHGLTWVMHRQVIEADRWPRLGEEVSVTTLPTHIDRRLITYRDFYLLDGDGRPLIRSTSTWSVMHLETRRIRPIPDEVVHRLGTLPDPATHLPRPGGKLVPPATPTAERHCQVAFSHLDFNNHLTNPAFPELMLEPLGLDFLSSHLPRHADISYHREARYGDTLTARTAPDGQTTGFLHALYRNDSELLATMATHWTPL
ncbi:acyl-ACP thioesterase [Lewinella marina]|uniref:acyl-[acyl-carrier-protein] thioesterase n=1 Tax=Neolewinella marina TaxID=438751 RepID=UPI00143046E0|nr:acyl-ACP thioesterase domain-containing protein [Neolewinella marina]NJB87009.1 acyl-ACP thioesterase [Neolewinella marina]